MNLVAIGIGVFIFIFICVKSSPPPIEALHPSASLYELTTIKAFAAIKNALQVKYFGDKHWHFEMLEPVEGTAFFVAKFSEQTSSKSPPVDRTILLNVKVDRVSSVISVRFDYDPVSYLVIELHQAADICNQTTEFLEQQLQIAASKNTTA